LAQVVVVKKICYSQADCISPFVFRKKK